MCLYEDHASQMYVCFNTAADLTALRRRAESHAVTTIPRICPWRIIAPCRWGAPDQVRRWAKRSGPSNHPGEPWPGDDSVDGTARRKKRERRGDGRGALQAPLPPSNNTPRIRPLTANPCDIKQLVDEGKLRVAEYKKRGVFPVQK
jgi:hypothetical protein